MKLKPVAALRGFSAWWGHNLLSCLPERWSAALRDAGNRFELILLHQDNSIVAMNAQGKLIDSIAVDSKADIDLDMLPEDDSIVVRLSNTQLKATENLISDQDPPLSLESDSLDIDLTEPQQPLSAGALDLMVDGPDPDTGENPNGIVPPSLGDVPNVIALNIQRAEDSTVVLDDGDQTAQFLESGSEEDTVIIKGDQGKLLQFDSAGKIPKDSTVLFRSFDGKIRKVEADDLDTGASADSGPGAELQINLLSQEQGAEGYAKAVRLLELHLGRRKGLYLIPDNKVLSLSLSYPIEAIQNIESVLKYDLEKHIPVSRQEVRYFYALNIDASQEKVSADVAVIRSDEYDLLNLSFEAFARKGLLCTTEKFYREYGSRINFLDNPVQQGWQSLIGLSNLHLGLNWLLFILLLVAPFWVLDRGLAALEEKSAAEVNRVRELVAEFNTTSAESDFGQVLARRINTTPRTIDLLSELSQYINKQAWLHQFSFKNNEIRIKGEADSATAVSDDLNRTGLFQSIKFVSSIVKNARSGKESFELLLTLKSNAKSTD